ncbi:MAG: NAD-glutamate dehydrogenase [Pseudomonadota bacterium]
MLEKEAKKIVSNVLALIRTNVKDHKLITQFARRYLSRISNRDLYEKKVEELYGQLISHWQLIQQRRPGQLRIRAFNPTIKKDGWKSIHSIIQIAYDDMPFLIDSIRMEIDRMNFSTYLIISSGAMEIERDKHHIVEKIIPVGRKASSQSLTESAIYIEVSYQSNKQTLLLIEKNLKKILNDVKIIVKDWRKMRHQVVASIAELDLCPPALNKAEIDETKLFLQWLENNNFTFLGCRDYKYTTEQGEKVLKSITKTGLGVLRSNSKVSIRYLSKLPAEALRMLSSKQVLIFAKTRTRATIHRPAYTDYIGVKRFNKQGKFIGERRFIGLYTSSVYNSSTYAIPFIRLKVAKIIKQSTFKPDSHAGKALINILENLPRDDLFQASSDELLKLSLGILHLQDRQQVRLFIRKDSYGRFYSCFIFVPRDKFNTYLCEQMESILFSELNGHEISYEPLFSESVLVCIHYIIHVVAQKKLRIPSINHIEKQLVEISKTWRDRLFDALTKRYGRIDGLQYYNKYKAAFPVNYQENFSIDAAVEDIEKIEKLSADKPLDMDFYDPKDERGFIRFKVFQFYQTTPLSDALPILENMGLRVIGERPYPIRSNGNKCVWINDFDMHYIAGDVVDLSQSKSHFQSAFAAIWFGEISNDAFNKLVLTINLNWQEVTMLRAYARYFQQLGINFSAIYIAETLNSNPDITQCLVSFFNMKFNPRVKRSEKAMHAKERKIMTLLNQVTNLDQDRILYRYLEFIKATLRVNYFQARTFANNKPYLVFKFNPQLIRDIPLPRPMFELYVYSVEFEGVHLRYSKVARGGLRWSDRREDFRAETLGLMKAQQVKNACIIPQGAKGSFVVKHIAPTASRDEVHAAGVRCYRLFIQAMLSITDNIVNKKVVPPVDVVRYDDDDPYLVVAADKGTATFSDIANELAIAHNFWLGDAFASGGSTGYDHKKMGITARGAWESVKRHFRALGRDIQRNGFTVVGIGDMSGDVFGNGMLLSKHTRLIAAFNHLHIFIDPNPDPNKSFKERKRLFDLPRSTWMDYNAKLISKGGGVFNRSDKSIKLSPAIQQLIGVTKETAVPDELIADLLRMEVDLLWNGGIGIFVKASHETNSSLYDRANQNIRVNANELRCKVVGEGGNLGLTQLARIEYELNGGRIYTDFIDNSAGVTCSDHEVNIKIVLADAIANNKLTLEERNALLVDMTDEVAELVLRNNYRQAQAISLSAIRAANNTGMYSRFMNRLSERGKLDVDLEFLPSEKTLNTRKSKGKGFTCPEIAVLFAYSKNNLKEHILASTVPEDEYLSKMLWFEFPKVIGERFESEMRNHILRREIIATQVSNTLVNEMGLTFILRLHSESGASVESIVRAFTISQKVFGKKSLWHQIERLDLQIDTDTQFSMMRQLNRLIRRSTRWFLYNYSDDLNINKTVSKFAEPIAILSNSLSYWLIGEDKKNYEDLTQLLMEAGAPKKISCRIASVVPLSSVLDIVEIFLNYRWPVKDIAKAYYLIGEKMKLNWLRRKITELKPNQSWEALLRTGLRDDVDLYLRKLATVVLYQQNQSDAKAIENTVDTWCKENKASFVYFDELLAKVQSDAVIDATKLTNLVRELANRVNKLAYCLV